MPRLPDADSIPGGLPSGNSGRPQAHFDATSIQRGYAAEGEGMQRFAQGLNQGVQRIANTVEQIGLRQDADNYATVTTDYRNFVLDAENKAKLSQDPEEIEQLKLGHQHAIDQFSKQITNPLKREQFIRERSTDITRFNIFGEGKKFDLRKDGALADYETKQVDLRKKGLESVDPKNRTAVVNEMNDLVDEMRNNGYISAQDAVRRKQNFANSYAIDAINKLPPAERLGVLGGFKGGLAAQESGGVVNRVNQFGYTGLYQFGAPRLETLGVYQPGEGEDMKSWSKTSQSAPGKWSGKFSIPGYPQITNWESFRQSSEAQDAVMDIHLAKLDKEIAARGLDKYVGKQVGGHTLTIDGIKAMAHLGGIGGAEAAIKGTGDSRDANGTSVSSYARFGEPNGARQLTTFLDPRQIEQMKTQSLREIQNDFKIQDTASRGEVSTIQQLMVSDTQSILTTGQPVQELTSDRIARAMGADVAAQYEVERGLNQRYHDKTWNWHSEPDAYIMDALRSLQPAPGSPTYAREQKLYETATKQAEAMMKERRSDPAGAVEDAPGVVEARKANPEAGIHDMESMGPIIAQRRVAQGIIGVPPPQQRMFTHNEAVALYAPIHAAQSRSDIKDVLAQTYEMVRDAFGKADAEQALREILLSGKVDAQHAELIQQMMKQAARGQPISSADGRTADDVGINSATGRAMDELSAAQTGTASMFGSTLFGFERATPESRAAAMMRPVPDPGAEQMLRSGQVTPQQWDAIYGKGTAKIILQAPATTRSREEAAASSSTPLAQNWDKTSGGPKPGPAEDIARQAKERRKAQ